MRQLALCGWFATAFALATCTSNVAVPVGGGCSSDDVCLTGFCIGDTDASGKATPWAGGYCSGNCERSACPQGSCLVMADNTHYCVAGCKADGDCRAGYVCDQHISACLPDCRKGWSCGSSLTCNSSDGSCDLAEGTTPVGGACSSDNDCANAYCIRDTGSSGKATGWAGGYCSGDCTSNPSCPQGSCLKMADSNRYCVATCKAEGDCRSGYVCDRNVSACLPDCRKGWSCGSTLSCSSSNGNCELPAGTVEVGGACSSDNDCANGFCIRDTDASGKTTGWAAGYCSADCASDPSCPQGSCLKMADSKSYCVAGCATDLDCRSGYVCAQAVLACLPDCRKGWSCGSTLTCNSADGSCQ
jgi:hypothetical protein